MFNVLQREYKNSYNYSNSWDYFVIKVHLHQEMHLAILVLKQEHTMQKLQVKQWDGNLRLGIQVH